MANYPTSAPSFTSRSSGQTIQPAHVNDLQDEVTAIGTVLVNSLNVAANVITSVKFPASQVASANANTLDDYEEGTCTPTLVSSGGGAAVYSSQSASYNKTGNKVFVTGRVSLSGLGTLAAGTLSIGGLPFTSGTDYAMCQLSWSTNGTSVVFMSGTLAPASTTISIQHLTAAATIATLTQVVNIGAAADFVFSVTYLV